MEIIPLLDDINQLYTIKNNIENLTSMINTNPDISINCVSQYKKFIMNNNYDDVKLCHNNISKDMIKIIDENNPVDIDANQEQCKLITTKKIGYYIHKYNPSIILDNINKDYLNYIKEISDIDDDNTPRCNCISICLYNPSPEKLSSYKYLATIKRTIKNVKSQLPKWLVRIYLDTTIFEYIKTYSSPEEKQILQFITESDNVEIYTYICNKIIDQRIPISLTRTFRFLPLIDKTVNICIIREADGIVSYLDCHNIHIFEKSSQLFYLIPFENSHRIDGFNNPHISYSTWLTYYKSIMNPKYFLKKTNFCDLLAGLFGTKLKIKNDIYHKYIIDTINKIYDEENKETILLDTNVIDYNGEINKHLNLELLKRGTTPPLLVGFDEIFLLELFKNLISFKYHEENKKFIFSDDTKKMINSIFISESNIKVIQIVDNDIVNNINKLVNKKLSETYINYLKNMYQKFDNMNKFRYTKTTTNHITKKSTIREINGYKYITDDIRDENYDYLIKNPFEDKFILYIYDSLLCEENGIFDYAFDVMTSIPGNNKILNILQLSNMPYIIKKDGKNMLAKDYDNLYEMTSDSNNKNIGDNPIDYQKKYMKYKFKYITTQKNI